MAAKDRIQAIKQMVANDKKVTVSNLSGIFQVTEETIRRDLEKLEDEGRIIVIRPHRPMEVDRIETDIKKLTDLYDEGYACAKKIFEEKHLLEK